MESDYNLAGLAVGKLAGASADTLPAQAVALAAQYDSGQPEVWFLQALMSIKKSNQSDHLSFPSLVVSVQFPYSNPMPNFLLFLEERP